MPNMYVVKVPHAMRQQVATALVSRPLNCFIEEQGWMDGSTAWGFIVACFHKKIGVPEELARKLRVELGGYSAWLETKWFTTQDFDYGTTKTGNPEGEQA